MSRLAMHYTLPIVFCEQANRFTVRTDTRKIQSEGQSTCWRNFLAPTAARPTMGTIATPVRCAMNKNIASAIAIFILGFGLRLGRINYLSALGITPLQASSQAIEYVLLAKGLLHTGGWSANYFVARPPLMPLLIAAVYAKDLFPIEHIRWLVRMPARG